MTKICIYVFKYKTSLMSRISKYILCISHVISTKPNITVVPFIRPNPSKYTKGKDVRKN